MTDEAARIAESLMPLEREWITGWQGPAGAAFNAIAAGLRHKGLLKGAMDWNLNDLGIAVRTHLTKDNKDG